MSLKDAVDRSLERIKKLKLKNLEQLAVCVDELRKLQSTDPELRIIRANTLQTLIEMHLQAIQILDGACAK